jgi:hypothetical protein
MSVVVFILNRFLHYSTWFWVLSFLLIVLAYLKEFWYDYKYETPEIRRSSKLDFWMYMLGWSISQVVIYFT